MKSFSVKTSEFEFGNRLVPSFYYYTQIVKEENKKYGIEYEVLEELCDTISDGEHSHIKRNKKEGIRYLYGRNIKEGIINFDPISDDPYISKNDYVKFTRCHIKQNDVLIAIYGTIGKSAVYKKEYVGVAGIPRHISNIRLKEASNKITPEFLTAYFRSKLGKGQLFSTTTGNIQQLLSLKNIRKLDIPIPEKEIIKQITEIETKGIDCEIKALAFIQKAKSFFYEITNIKNQDFEYKKDFETTIGALKSYDLWIPKYSFPYYNDFVEFLKNSYKIEKLGNLVDIKNGDEVGSKNYINYEDKRETDVAFIRTSDIVNFEIDQYPDYFVDKSIFDDLNQDIKHNDIILTKDGKIGLTALIGLNDNVIISSGISRLRINEYAKEIGVTPEYVFLILAIKEIGLFGSQKRSVVASTIPHLREERMKDIEIPILDDDSIKGITELVSKAFILKDKRKLLVKESINILDNYFKLE